MSVFSKIFGLGTEVHPDCYKKTRDMLSKTYYLLPKEGTRHTSKAIAKFLAEHESSKK